MQSYGHYIDGAFRAPLGQRWLDSVNPYTGEVWAKIAAGCARDADLAVQAAARALKGPWSKLTASQRGLLLIRLADLVEKNAERLAEIEVRDNGKLMSEMLGQLRYQPNYWRYLGGLADKIQGQVVPVDKADMFAFTRKEPVGVVVALTAWNSPLLFLTMKCGAALAAGCTVVLKPSEFTSVSALEFMKLIEEAGFPSGVVNVVTGLGQDVGAALVDHPEVAKISFTGSDVTGAKIYAQAAAGMKRVSLELGGKSPNIVFADCDQAAAASGVISGIFAATGQTCIAGSRLLVQNSIKDAFVERLLGLAKTARKGDPMRLETNIGPVTTPAQYRKILDYIEIAKAEGATCILGGSAATGPALTGGQFVEPTIFTDVTPDMRIAREEVFGPVLSIMGFEDEAEAVALANDTIYGLAAGVWTKDMARSIRLSEQLRAGTVWINTYRAGSYMMPFGGMKMSGINRENGTEALEPFLETKSVMLNLSDAAPANPFVMR